MMMGSQLIVLLEDDLNGYDAPIHCPRNSLQCRLPISKLVKGAGRVR
jgi:hypothetical protein